MPMTTSTRIAKRRIRTARADIAAARVALRRDTRPLRESLRRHRIAWICAGGFLGGIALGTVSPRVWGQIGAVLGSSAAVAARSLLTPLVAGAIVARARIRDDAAANAMVDEETSP